VGDTVTEIGGYRVTIAVPDLVPRTGSTVVAVTVTAVEVVTVAGAV
jgi:hypothetical protein